MNDHAERREELLEGTYVLEVPDGAKVELLFVPPGFPLHPQWLEHLRKEPLPFWRSWWERWYRPPCDCDCDCCCCCCCREARAPAPPPAPPVSNLAIDLHLNHLVLTGVVGGTAPSLGYVIHLGWTVTGATGQVTVTLEWRVGTRPYQQVVAVQGTTMADYAFPPPVGAAAPIVVYPQQTYWFKATATDATATASSELPVQIP